MLCIVWKDSSEVALLSTIHKGSTSGTTVKRRAKGECKLRRHNIVLLEKYPSVFAFLAERKDIPCPLIIPDYKKYMGCVGKFDQMTSFYAVLRRVYCWPIVFLYNCIETTATNTFHIYKCTTDKKVSSS